MSDATATTSGRTATDKPLVLITGAVGNLGVSVAKALEGAYRVVGMDRDTGDTPFPVLRIDVSSDDSVELAFRKLRESYGNRIASVIHLVAFFDFTGQPHPLYQTVNVEGTRRVLRALRSFEVEQFVYASTMLVHAPCKPGERIDERQPIDPRWEYPKSKAAAEAVIREEHGNIPYAILRLAGVYDTKTTVPTMANQMARIYERDLQSHLYAGHTLVGQSMLQRVEQIVAMQHRLADQRVPGV